MDYDTAMTTSYVPSNSQQSDERSFRDVLFVCDHNAGRSQMAQAFFERDAPEDLRAESAGTQPTAAIWPQVVEVMREVGFDLAARKPKKLTLEMQLHADWAITMGCGDACPYVPAMVEAWDCPDPAGLPIEDVRAIRDGIEAHVRELLSDRLEAIRSDPTARQLRLARLLPMLAGEFADTKPAQEIRACADAVLTGFDGARVRTHVMILAHRQTRDCLRRDTCDLLATQAPS
jgi:protein-tyrosine-phosphatase